MFDRKAYRKAYMKKYLKKWRKDNLEYIKEYSKKWQVEHRECNAEGSRKYRKNNLDKVRESAREYQSRPENRMKGNKWQNERKRNDLKFNINGKMATSIWKSIRKNKAGRNWGSLIGYTLNDLVKHLTKTMPTGYTWQDYLKGNLHIDHIIPVSAFNFTESEHTDFKRCWALKNLRLLPARENLIKHNKLYKPFQPALAL